jgi:PQQ-like domain
VSKDGKTVFVTGYSSGGFVTGFRPVGYVTVAYDAATGARRWVSRFKGRNEARDLAISPDGTTLYVTGRGFGASHWAYLTVAYDAATGAARWAARYHGPADGDDYANRVVAAPGGTSVYVTGGIRGRSSGADFATVAYNAATGAQRWAARGPGTSLVAGTSLAVTPDGRTVIAAGQSVRPNSSPGLYLGYAAVAFNAATGAATWTRRALGWPDPGYPHTLAISPDSSTVYVTGSTPGECCDSHYATVAYAIATGARLWLSTYHGPYNKSDQANALALSPDGRTLYVTGVSSRLTSAGFATIAYQT